MAHTRDMTHSSTRAAGAAGALVLFALLLCAAPAHARCPIDTPDCGVGGTTTVTWTNTLTVTHPSRGAVTSQSTSANGIDCGTDCTGASRQTTVCSAGDCLDPDPAGWDDFTLSAVGGPSGFSPVWTGCDSVGNGQCHVHLDRDVTVSMTFVDTTDPTVSLSVPGKVGAVAHVAAAAGDNDAVARVEWFVDDNPTPALVRTAGQVLSGTIDLSSPAFADGSQVTIRARATDASGRISATQSKVVTLDKHVRLTVGAVPAFAAAVPVPAVATDPDALVACAVSGALTIAHAPCAAPLPAGAPDGGYTYTDTASDDVGNLATVTRTFVLDRTPPVIAGFDGPPEGGEVSTRSVTMSFDVSDANLAAVTCALDGGTATPCTTSATLSGLSAGTHRFTVTAADKAGNTVHTIRTFAVKSPTTTITPPPAGGGGGTTTDGGVAPGPGTPVTIPPGPATHLAANPARLVLRSARHGTSTRLRTLVIRHAAKGSRITVRCAGPRCPRRTLVATTGRGTVELTTLEKRSFRAGTLLTIRIARPGMRTRTVTVRIRRGAHPKVS